MHPGQAGLDLPELTEYAWHDCYQEITPPDEVILNILICSRGDLATMAGDVDVERECVTDWFLPCSQILVGGGHGRAHLLVRVP